MQNTDRHDLVSKHTFCFACPLFLIYHGNIELRNTFCVCSALPLVFSFTSFFFFFPSLCGAHQIERARHQFKGQTRVSASRAFTSVLTESRVNCWEMFHRSRHIMQPRESRIKLSLTPSLLHFYCPAHPLTNLQPRLHWRV